jgi:hypothetical protein
LTKGNYLSSEECDEIIAASIGKDMTKAETITEGDTQSRTHCQVSWIPSTGPQKSELVSNLVSSTANLLLSKDILTNPSAGVEDLQVLKYEEGGEFVLHHGKVNFTCKFVLALLCYLSTSFHSIMYLYRWRTKSLDCYLLR